MVIDALVRRVASQLTENARFEAEQIVMKAVGITHGELILKGKDVKASDAQIRAVREMTARRKNGEPLWYIIGECSFMSLDFYVSKGVLIPRPDTETLVETVISAADKKRELNIIDICAGSGCIGISLAHYLPNAAVDMLDVSDTALETARKNIIRNNVSGRVNLIKADILNEYPDKKYDIAVSNPPYIETDTIDALNVSVKDYEPRLALDGGDDGLLFYRRIISIADKILKENALLAFEIGYDQAKSVTAIMTDKFTDIRVIRDLADNDRVVTGILK